MRALQQPTKVLSGKCDVLGTASFSGIDADILIGGENAPMTVMALAVQDGFGAPEHISHGEDKVFLIEEGQFCFLVGDNKFVANAGERVFVPRGIKHSFTPLGSDSGRMTLVSTPGKHDRFFQAMSSLKTPHSMEDVAALCEKFDQTIVGLIVKP